ncbi:MAG TPA: hypothetical protein VK966_03105 [Longimicrobiales bacterium]|nr:hypothetical protein [Longimicrobiales bacterium]
MAAPEVAGVRQCRVLLGSFDAGALHDTAMEYGPAGRRERVARLEVLRDFMGSGRLLVRSAGLASWIPDFGVVRGTRAVALLGSNHFGTPYTAVGPSFTLCTTDPRVVKLLTERFQETWEYGHDVLPAIQSVVSNALTRGDEGALGSG